MTWWDIGRPQKPTPPEVSLLLCMRSDWSSWRHGSWQLSAGCFAPGPSRPCHLACFHHFHFSQVPVVLVDHGQSFRSPLFMSCQHRGRESRTFWLAWPGSRRGAPGCSTFIFFFRDLQASPHPATVEQMWLKRGLQSRKGTELTE